MVHLDGEDHWSIRAARSIRFFILRPQLRHPLRRSTSIHVQPRCLPVPSYRPVTNIEPPKTSNPNISLQHAFPDHLNASIKAVHRQSLRGYRPFFRVYFWLVPAIAISSKNAVFLRLRIQILKHYGFNCAASWITIIPPNGYGRRRLDAMQVLEKLEGSQGAVGALRRHVWVSGRWSQNDRMGQIVI